MPTSQDFAVSRGGVVDDTRTLFAQTMGLVAITCAFAAGGAYLGRDLGRGTGLLLMLVAFGLIFGMNVAIRRSQQLATIMLFALGLIIGMSVGPILAYYAETDPAALWQSAGATALFIGALGTVGYLTKRDLSSWSRALFFALLGLIVFGLLTVFISIPGGNIIYAVLGLVVFGFYTVFDFNRLARVGDVRAAPLIAASIFLDIFNVFLFFLQLFGNNR